MNYVSKKMMGKVPYEPIQGDYKVRLDANESPFPVSKEIIEKFTEWLSDNSLNRYPDPCCKALRAAFAKRYGVDVNCVVAGNGSDELISVIMTSLFDSGDSLIVATPEFSMYAFYAGLSENTVYYTQKGENYNLDSLLEFVKEKGARAVVFSNPCNPTGQGFDRASVLSFVEKCPALCIVDEAYMDFWNQSILDMCDRYENLLVLRTLSKAFGAAGLRLGFAVGHRSLINALDVARSPYNVNSLSQQMGKLILESDINNGAFLAAQAQKLSERLAGLLPEAKIYPTCANLVYLEHKNSKQIYEGLLERGVAVRFFSPDRLRITASTDDELDVLYSAISDIMKGLE
ncbi:MAG: histidinol-phosphate aminotransferase family protein [Ruminococcaceae bacterium]|nr:histidinol-phosphate aminotransferase family protein [Oscillospiraceae bacterium]